MAPPLECSVQEGRGLLPSVVVSPAPGAVVHGPDPVTIGRLNQWVHIFVLFPFNIIHREFSEFAIFLGCLVNMLPY